MSEWSQNSQDLKDRATALAGSDVVGINLASKGANSSVYRVSTLSGLFALKSYPQRSGDSRDRLDVEWRALHFLRARGIASVPQPFARDSSARLVLMEWIDGRPISIHSREDLDGAALFVTSVFGLSQHADAAEFSLASEACLSAKEIFQQIESRISLLAAHPRLKEFLSIEFAPRLQAALGIVAAELDTPTDLPPYLRKLIPADFGFHNALRQTNGTVRFFDFDYFGWDDPVKLTADFLVHPAMSLSAFECTTFTEHLRLALPDDEDFADRLARHLPLYALRWALILLNVFRSDRQSDLRPDSFREEQLEKARAMCERAEGLCQQARYAQ